jgi:hypothetical protein
MASAVGDEAILEAFEDGTILEGFGERVGWGHFEYGRTSEAFEEATTLAAFEDGTGSGHCEYGTTSEALDEVITVTALEDVSIPEPLVGAVQEEHVPNED